mmetsp:Transcript_25757/g.61017  ORF Transcript_25757/g.61017 Transcript_25757/m.61017 type:complete len:87 (+) Transcript_25757:153-413(+)
MNSKHAFGVRIFQVTNWLFVDKDIPSFDARVEKSSWMLCALKNTHFFPCHEHDSTSQVDMKGVLRYSIDLTIFGESISSFLWPILH